MFIAWRLEIILVGLALNLTPLQVKSGKSLWNPYASIYDGRRKISSTVICKTTRVTSSLHDPAVPSVILIEYMIIAFTTNGQSFRCIAPSKETVRVVYELCAPIKRMCLSHRHDDCLRQLTAHIFTLIATKKLPL